MKKTVLILLFGIFFSNTISAQKYFGKNYTPTRFIDEYYESTDVKKTYTVMGRAEMDQGFRSLEKCQSKIIELAKKKGADGVIFSVDEEVYGTSNSNSATAFDKKKNKSTVTSSGTSVDLKQKTVKAVFIKYDDETK